MLVLVQRSKRILLTNFADIFYQTTKKTNNYLGNQCHDKKCTFAVCGVWIICLIFFKCLVEHNRYLETLTQE